MATIQELTAIGKDLGLSGDNLVSFVKDQQALAREERAQQRAFEKEMRQRETDDKEKQRQAEAERERLQADERDRQRAAEIEKEQRQAHEREQQRAVDERDKERNAELDKQRLEVELSKEKIRLEMHRTTSAAGSNRGSDRDDDLDDDIQSNPDNSATRSRTSKFKGPKMTPFDEKDEIDSYLHRFENYATTQNWEKQNWAVYLAALLRGRALDVYARLPIEQANDYSILRDSLLKRYNKTEEGYKQHFHTCKAEIGESPQQFIIRLASYLSKWIQLSKVEATFNGLSTLIVREQFLSTCSKDLEVFLRERAITDLTQLAKLAEQYLGAHKQSSLSGTGRTTTATVTKVTSEPAKPTATGTQN